MIAKQNAVCALRELMLPSPAKRPTIRSPHRSVGAGRASGAVAFELVTFAKPSSSHVALQGGAFILPVGQEVEAAGPLGRAF